MNSTVIDISVHGLLKAYQQKQATPDQVINYVLERCTQFENHNIWISRLTREQIQPYLDALDGQSPESLPLYGIPFAIKDNIDLAGVPTTAACPAFTYTPEKSAFVVQQLTKAGAIPVGKTNMDQFATGLVGTRSPDPWGPCKNSFNKEYISGGSSSGSAVAVALGLVSFSLGTDTAGSGRVPAAFNNIIGVKPSKGIISTQGVVPACRTLDCVSVFSLTTDDANLILNSAIEFDRGDDFARINPFENNGRFYGKGTSSLTIGVPAKNQLQFFGNAQAEQLFNDSVTRLREAGVEIREIDFSPFMQSARLLYEGPWVAERYVAVEKIVKEKPESLLPVINKIVNSANDKHASDYFKAAYQLQHYRQLTDNILSEVDCIVTPTAGTIYTIDEVLADPIQLNSNLGYYTNYMNLLDCASVAVPAGYFDNGLPFGITFAGPALSDRKLLSIANFWQQAMQYNLGRLELPCPPTSAAQIDSATHIQVIVCGAHMTGLALNWQLTERGAVFVQQTKTAACYRIYVLPGGPPQRPGLIRDESEGSAIECEVWSVPGDQFGSFVANIPAPLGIGKVELEDGKWLPGFICEAYAVQKAQEITELSSWRNYLSTLPGKTD